MDVVVINPLAIKNSFIIKQIYSLVLVIKVNKPLRVNSRLRAEIYGCYPHEH